MSNSNKDFKEKIVDFIEKYEVLFYAGGLILTVLSIPLSLAYFPDDTMATFIMVALTGVVNGLGTLATALISQQDREEKEEVDADS